MGSFDWFIMIPVGLVLLYFGGNFLIRSSIALSIRLSIPRYIIGSTIVAFGTSLPELFSAVAAARAEEGILVFSSLMGSNIVNIAVILSIGLLFLNQRSRWKIARGVFRISLRNRLFFLLSALFPILLAFAVTPNAIILGEGVFLLFIYCLYIFFLFKNHSGSASLEVEKIEESVQSEKSTRGSFYVIHSALIFVSFAMLAYGGEIVVTAIRDILDSTQRTTKLARFLSVSVISIGTSLPELVTSLVSVKKQEYEVMLGNIVGSCIANMLCILPIAVFFSPVFITFDLLFDSAYLLLLVLWIIGLTASWKCNQAIRILKIQGAILFITVMGYFYSIAQT